jgi:hypothetical protein
MLNSAIGGSLIHRIFKSKTYQLHNTLDANLREVSFSKSDIGFIVTNGSVDFSCSINPVPKFITTVLMDFRI